MIFVQLSNIKRIEDLTLMNDVNRRLQHGWLLIDTYINNYDPITYPSENTIHYVLGLPEGVEYIDTPQDTNNSASDIFTAADGFND